MLTATPAPGRLEAAAADPSLDEARVVRHRVDESLGGAVAGRLALRPLRRGWRRRAA